MQHTPATCKSCGQPILWAQVLEDDRKTIKIKPRRCNFETPKAQVMPVDWQPDPDGRVVVLDRRGSVVAYVLKKDEPPPPGVRLRIAHHITCKHAAQWKAAARERKRSQ